MTAAPEFAVTLSPPLYHRLRAEADRLGLSPEWLAAALVADTFEAAGRAAPGGPVQARDEAPAWYEPVLPLLAADGPAPGRRPRTESHRPIGRDEALARLESWRGACA